ncbi:DUF4387 domain-containing protein [Vagococcus carniphilus]|uniref:DUF4387 domain-containing protein n=1 Tax=Vagococcus carniphilus TaxID=218144 RepID=A0AAW8U7V7_9ENTE|nr:DUF4387 domain-containing protein [Vagococcus carniphilus]MDT2815952.1 DUF4387 domain-containing protein [Vagococcus carniphilus]MDT2834412.1 DUF4387 domain-containing protein [Vagococcus carniphilus]MDT2864328.1 DUF4387 domain-containing protein [Vagococcus carniphilus]
MLLQEYAQVIRSKNSGPFELTIDIIFKSLEDYQFFKEKELLTIEKVAELYQMKQEEIINFEYFEAARGIKITIPRPWNQGSIGESDMHGSQQYANLLSVEVPE